MPVLGFEQECAIHVHGSRDAGCRTGELPNRDELAEKSSAMFVIMADRIKPATEEVVQPLEETSEQTPDESIAVNWAAQLKIEGGGGLVDGLKRSLRKVQIDAQAEGQAQELLPFNAGFGQNPCDFPAADQDVVWPFDRGHEPLGFEGLTNDNREIMRRCRQKWDSCGRTLKDYGERCVVRVMRNPASLQTAASGGLDPRGDDIPVMQLGQVREGVSVGGVELLKFEEAHGPWIQSGDQRRKRYLMIARCAPAWT
jgi:hypothetical protein